MSRLAHVADPFAVRHNIDAFKTMLAKAILSHDRPAATKYKRRLDSFRRLDTWLHRNPLSVVEVITSAAVRRGLMYSEVVGKAQSKRLHAARVEIAQTLAADPYNMSQPEIARAIGNRHHSSIGKMLLRRVA